MASDPGARQPFSVSPAHLTMLVVCVVSVYFIIGFYGKSLDSYRINQRALVVRQEIALLETRNRQLQDEIAYYQSESYVETAARDKLNLVRPGDRSVVTLPAPQAAIGPPAAPAAEGSGPFLPSFGHLGEWVELFLGQRF
jgi:cell division protein FtsB